MKKIVSTIAAVALTAGIGFAASNASAASAQTALGAPVAQTGIAQSGVEKAGFRVRIHFGHRYGYRHYGRRCYFAGYRYYFHHRFGWIKKPVYRCFYRYY